MEIRLGHTRRSTVIHLLPYKRSDRTACGLPSACIWPLYSLRNPFSVDDVSCKSCRQTTAFRLRTES